MPPPIPLRETIHRYFAPHRHSALLAVLIAAFAVRPLIGDSNVSSAVFGVVLILVLLIALFNINVDEMVGEKNRLAAQNRRRRFFGWILAAAAMSERVAVMFVHNRTLNLVGSFCWLIFIVYITWSQLRSLLKQREVTGQTICMAVTVYLLMGFSFALLFALMFERHPESFSGILAANAPPPTEFQHFFPVFGYFSLTTLSTIGFGDITPLTLQARYAAVAEGITGQFYMAILVARLVGMQMVSKPADRSTENSRR